MKIQLLGLAGSIVLLIGIRLIAIAAQPGPQIWQSMVGGGLIALAVVLILAAARCKP